MKNYILIFILFILIRFSFSDTITVDGIQRNYIVHLPSSYDVKTIYPLVLALHGGGGKAEGMNKLSGFDDISDEYNFIVVYPSGIDKQWNDGRNDFHLNKDIDDVKFISCLIDSLKNKYIIDSKRVYVTGISNGAIMGFRLACELSDKIAAFATVAGSMPQNPDYECNPQRPVPIMIIFGDSDPIVPYMGGDITVLGFGKRGKVIPVEQSVSYWVDFDGCNIVPVETKINNKNDGTDVIKKTYSSNTGGVLVQYWLVEGGGHCWPGGDQYLPKIIIGKTSREFNASEEIWKFFSDKALN